MSVIHRVHWRAVEQLPPLAPGVVHIWHINCNIDEDTARSSQDRLSETEQLRAKRFVRPPDRLHFIASQYALRQILSRYLECDLTAIEYTYGTYKKPYLAHNRSLQFNLSHSGGMALVAVTLDAEVGVDIEPTNRAVDHLGLASQCFASDEIKIMKALSEGELAQAFFKIWTCKEAYVKAKGTGLHEDLQAFVIGYHSSGEQNCLLTIDHKKQSAEAWTINSFYVDDVYVGAVAIERRDITVQYLVWDARSA